VELVEAGFDHLRRGRVDVVLGFDVEALVGEALEETRR
jgi:hypothetical protein